MRPPQAALLALVVLCLVPSLARFARSDDRYGELPAQGCPARGQFNLDHFARMTGRERIERGGKPSEAGVACLAASGVRVIIDLRSEGELRSSREKAWAEARGIRYLSFPMTTDSRAASAECVSAGRDAAECNRRAVDGAVETLARFLAQEEGGVYIHCARGEDRTGLVLGTFRLREDRWTKDRARREMDAFFYSPYPPLEQVWRSL